jgi:serine/threonine protein kinase
MRRNIVPYKSVYFTRLTPEEENSNQGDQHFFGDERSESQQHPATGNDEKRSTTVSAASSATTTPSFSQAGHRSILFIAMRFCNAGTLANYINDSNLTPTNRLKLLFDAANGLAFAHKKNVIHRDIKPENVFVHKEENSLTAMIGDFGLSCSSTTNDEGKQVAPASADGGTFIFGSPEQLNGETHGMSTDVRLVFAVFCHISFHLLTLAFFYSP